MANPVFSSQFILNDSDTGYTSFLVPDGFVAVIRDFSAWSDAGGFVVQLVIRNSLAAPGVTVAAVTAAGVPNYAQWQGRIVLPPGGEISTHLASFIDEPSIYVGGYLLAETYTR